MIFNVLIVLVSLIMVFFISIIIMFIIATVLDYRYNRRQRKDIFYQLSRDYTPKRRPKK